MTKADLKAVLIATLLGRGTRGDDDLQAASEFADRLMQMTAGPETITEEARDFAGTIQDDLATDADGDPAKMWAFWVQVRTILDKELQP